MPTKDGGGHAGSWQRVSSDAGGGWRGRDPREDEGRYTSRTEGKRIDVGSAACAGRGVPCSGFEGSSYPGGEWFARFVESSPDLVMVAGPHGGVRYVTPSVERLLGYSSEEFVRLAPDLAGLVEGIIHPEDREFAARELAEAVSGPSGPRSPVVAVRVRHKDGSWRFFEGYVNNLVDAPEVSGLVFVSRDVTERVRAEEEARRLRERLEALVEERTEGLRATVAELEGKERALEEGEERYRRLVQNVREGIGFVGPEGGIVEYCNEAYAGVLGLPPKDLVGRSFFDFVVEGQREGLRQSDFRLEGEGSDYELMVAMANGRKKTVSCGGYPLFGSDGSYQGSVHTLVDVTERKLAEEALKASEERFRLTFDRAAVGMAHVAPGGAWVRVNDKLCDIVGYSREEFLGRTFQDITHPDDLEKDLRHVRRMLAGEISEYSMEKRYICKDRSRVWIELTVSMIRNSDGEPDYFISVVEDVTPRKLKELMPDPLTCRELEVLRLVVAGLTNPQISCCICHSLSTVKLCVQRIISKLGCDNRKQAASRAIEIGLVSPNCS